MTFSFPIHFCLKVLMYVFCQGLPRHILFSLLPYCDKSLLHVACKKKKIFSFLWNAKQASKNEEDYFPVANQFHVSSLGGEAVFKDENFWLLFLWSTFWQGTHHWQVHLRFRMFYHTHCCMQMWKHSQGQKNVRDYFFLKNNNSTNHAYRENCLKNSVFCWHLIW